jgi:uncharacterized protein YdaU (DUF1376 family)
MNRPWMPLYVADYLADTAHLSAAEHGGYLLLIMHYWQTGGLPIDDAKLARIARMTTAEWRRTRDTIAPFFADEWRHKRIDTEIARATDISSKRRAAAEQRHSKPHANADANAELLQTHARTCASALQPQSQKASPSLPSLDLGSSSEVLSEEVSTGDTPARDASGVPEARTLVAMVEAYNAVAREVGWAEAKHTPRRVPALRQRLKDAGDYDGWRRALTRARGSPFLTGDNDRGWRADLDFLLQAKSFNKLMEGGYDGRPNGRQSHNGSGPRRNGHDAFLAGLASLASDTPGDDPLARGAGEEIPSGRFNIDG